MNCVLELNAYQVESVAVASNETFDRKLDAHTGDIATSVNIAPHARDTTRYRLTLEIQVKPTAQKEKEFFAYFVAIKGRAYFALKDPCHREEADKALRLNGASILYGLLRAQVAQITAQSVYGQFLLPTINFLELAKTQTPVEGGGPAAKPTSEGLYGGTASTTPAPCVREEKAVPRTGPAPSRPAKRKGAYTNARDLPLRRYANGT